jgi:aminoglycoside phosphotransferase (APT) family kinase protein
LIDVQMRDHATEVPGIDAEKVEAWMLNLPIGATPPLTFSLIGHGKSNVTAAVADARGRRWVLRRPPLGDLLPTAHDVAREYRILAALSDTNVPVPRPVALTVDASITDVPLMLMEHVDGIAIDEMAVGEALSPDVRHRVGIGMVDTLAAAHAVDLDAAGLSDLASHRPYAARQLKRWRTQWEQSRAGDDARIDDLAERLAAAMPDQDEVRLVHGDSHLRNVLVADDGTVRALLDWELSTLGDPLADLGLLLAYWPEGDEHPWIPAPVTVLPGFAKRDELVARYASVTGRDVSAVGFWEVLGLWKVAIIYEGVRRRALDDARNAERGATIERETIETVVARALDAAAAAGI